MLCRKRRIKLNRYTDERIYLWTCRAVVSMGRSLLLIRLNKSMKMNRQGHEQVHLWAGTQAVVVTGRFLLLGKGEA